MQLTASPDSITEDGRVITKDEPFAFTAIGRKWKWDIAYPLLMLAIEVDGGIWVQGAHGHPTTILRNMEKRNWGARLGWRVLAFTPDQVRDGSALDFVLAVLDNKTTLTTRELYARKSTVPRQRRTPRAAARPKKPPPA